MLAMSFLRKVSITEITALLHVEDTGELTEPVQIPNHPILNENYTKAVSTFKKFFSI